VRHDDRRRDAEEASGQRDRLGVVARRERDDTGAALRVAEPRQGAVGAAELEGAAALEVLGLEGDLGTEQLVDEARAQYRGAVGMAVEPRGSRGDIGVRRELGVAQSGYWLLV